MSYIGKYTPSLLDALQQYLDSEALYEKFYGHSEEPSLSFEEYERKQFQELIDKINRVPFESEAADKGSCLNEIVDCIVMGKNSTREDISLSTMHGNYPSKPCILAQKGGRSFFFDIPFCKEVAEYFSGSLCQMYVEAPIETKYGTVLLYGYPDYVRMDMVYDLKTTSKYEFGKYQKYWQQHVYPWALTESGKCEGIKAFEFSAFALKGGSERSPLIVGDFYPEVYPYDHGRSERLLRGVCEQFYEFLNNNIALIKDEKILGGDKKAA